MLSCCCSTAARWLRKHSYARAICCRCSLDSCRHLSSAAVSGCCPCGTMSSKSYLGQQHNAAAIDGAGRFAAAATVACYGSTSMQQARRHTGQAKSRRHSLSHAPQRLCLTGAWPCTHVLASRKARSAAHIASSTTSPYASTASPTDSLSNRFPLPWHCLSRAMRMVSCLKRSAAHRETNHHTAQQQVLGAGSGTRPGHYGATVVDPTGSVLVGTNIPSTYSM